MKEKISVHDLRIGQTVWVAGKEKTITSMEVYRNGTQYISFDWSDDVKMEEIYPLLSITPPKGTRRLWAWNINMLVWKKLDVYLDDDGKTSNGEIYYPEWKELEKVKIKKEFIDIDKD